MPCIKSMQTDKINHVVANTDSKEVFNNTRNSIPEHPLREATTYHFKQIATHCFYHTEYIHHEKSYRIW